MEAVCSLKPDRSMSLDACIICQESKKDKLYNATEQGLLTLKAAAQSRGKLHDPQHREAIDRVLLVQNTEQHMVWHRLCYASLSDLDMEWLFNE